MCVDSNKRLSAAQALQEPWIVVHLKTNDATNLVAFISPSMLESLLIE